MQIELGLSVVPTEIGAGLKLSKPSSLFSLLGNSLSFGDLLLRLATTQPVNPHSPDVCRSSSLGKTGASRALNAANPCSQSRNDPVHDATRMPTLPRIHEERNHLIKLSATVVLERFHPKRSRYDWIDRNQERTIRLMRAISAAASFVAESANWEASCARTLGAGSYWRPRANSSSERSAAFLRSVPKARRKRTAGILFLAHGVERGRILRKRHGSIRK